MVSIVTSSLVSCLLLAYTLAAADTYPSLFSGITPITIPDAVPIPPFNGPTCYPRFAHPFATPIRALFIVADGSDMNGYLAAYKYLADRGAAVETLCLPSMTTISPSLPSAGTGAVMMNIYYPLATVACTTTDKGTLDKLSEYNITYVPSGYLATLAMRQDGAVPSALKTLLNPTEADPAPAAVVLEGGAVELLVGTGVLGTLNITAANPFPSATPATTAAILVEVCQNNMDGSVDCGQSSPNTTGTFSFNASARRLFVAQAVGDLAGLLPWVAQVAFHYTGDTLVPPPADNNNTDANTTTTTTTTTDVSTTTTTAETTTSTTTTPTTTATPNGTDGSNTTAPLYPFAPVINCSIANITELITTNITNLTYQVLGAAATLIPVTNASWDALRNGRETNVAPIANITKDIPGECRNSAGINFCQGSRVSVVVAHGMHDAEVITAAGVFQQLGAHVELVCPDAQESLAPTGGRVFLSSNPAFVPTYQVQCTQFYNKTDLVTATLVIISGGPIATHGRLRMDSNLVSVIQYTGTFSAYGSAISLLDTILVGKDAYRPTDVDHSDVDDAPLCPLTNMDMALLSFNMTPDAISRGSRGLFNSDTSLVLKKDAPNMVFRTPELRRTKVLGGYLTDDVIMANFTQFLAFTAESLVWENGSSDSKDGVMVGILLGVCGLIVVVVIVAAFLRSKAPEKGFDRLPTEDPSDAASLSAFDRGIANKENTFYGSP